MIRSWWLLSCMAATDFVFIIKTRRAVVQESKESILKYKLAYSGIILFVYVIGKNIPLYALDISAYREAYFNVEELLLQSIGGMLIVLRCLLLEFFHL